MWDSFRRSSSSLLENVSKVGREQISSFIQQPTKEEIERKEFEAERAIWESRVNDFIENILKPFEVETKEDTTLNKASRILDGAYTVSSNIPIASSVSWLLSGVYNLKEYGMHGLGAIRYRSEIGQVIETLQVLVKDHQKDDTKLSDFVIATYYRMIIERGQRGNLPSMELQEHSNCESVDTDTICQTFHMLIPALFAYESDKFDVQRLAHQQGYETIICQTKNQLHRPSFHVFGRKRDRTVIVSIRGTDNLFDILTDGQIHPVQVSHDCQSRDHPIILSKSQAQLQENLQPNCECSFYAHFGILTAAEWLYDAISDLLLQLHSAEYKIVIVGHSLGGGVATLLHLMLKEYLNGIKCYTFGSPACISENLARLTDQDVISVVNHDDLIPRASEISARRLMTLLIEEKEKWNCHLENDLNDFKTRVQEVWAPRTRNTITQVQEVDHQQRIVNSSVTNEKIISESDNTELCPVHPDLETICQNLQKYFIKLITPGKIMHLYRVKGQVHTAWIPRDHLTVSQLQIQPSSIEDHKGISYHEALREAKAVRESFIKEPPNWVSFSERATCFCCNCVFTWASTSKSEIQELNGKHHCRSCGEVVCEECSKNKVSITEFGLVKPVRICDACFYSRI